MAMITYPCRNLSESFPVVWSIPGQRLPLCHHRQASWTRRKEPVYWALMLKKHCWNLRCFNKLTRWPWEMWLWFQMYDVQTNCIDWFLVHIHCNVVRWMGPSEAEWCICVSKLTIIGSDNGLSPGRHQAIIWTNAGILLIGSLGTNFSEILIEIHIFSLKKMHLKISSAKWQPFCLGLNVLMQVQVIEWWHHDIRSQNITRTSVNTVP